MTGTWGGAGESRGDKGVTGGNGGAFFRAICFQTVGGVGVSVGIGGRQEKKGKDLNEGPWDGRSCG